MTTGSGTASAPPEATPPAAASAAARPAAEPPPAARPPGTAGPPAARRGSYRRLSVEARRAELLTAALGLFAHRVPEDVSLDEVAAAAGASRPLVVRYVPGGKQQLDEAGGRRAAPWLGRCVEGPRSGPRRRPRSGPLLGSPNPRSPAAAALRSAADELERCFEEPRSGPLSGRLSRVLDRYLAFVDEHDAGFSALLQSGSVVETSRTNAIVDEVRRTAAEEILLHLAVKEPGVRLRMMVRTWITAVEAASLIWLDEEKQPPVEELRDWLVDHFVALLTATATTDPQAARVIRAALVIEPAEGPVGRLARRVVPALGEASHLL
ncbi:helix-turn-helix domain-containing protein [Streptomyces sp. 8ZJF_21]|uniref:helix-turn-helix domain-containing protein n=1 Tax=Streptomyces sp. 8ZJF_21 TaxID=2903141 RepID=UPI001E58B80D|nr:helix-turn-helix domain-containing protein [Streptomyces sp. 8ZJF_21]MCD9593953.1 TetR/AcrR family transcriptional regulator [Streptomyces sp. 8ZJF_21]